MGNQNGGMAKDSLEGRDVRQLDQHVSAELARGVKYNMKILIRGQRKTGKTQLLRRIQGLEFVADYTPTPEISTAHLIWTCPATDEKVKVEFWDVVDKGIQPNQTWAGVTGGKGAETAPVAAPQENLVLLDAATIDVNRGCDGVIIVHDPSRPETLAYSLALLKDIKEEIPVILVANFADARAFVKTKELAAAVRKRERCACACACSKDGFGVDLVRDFLTVPFLAIKQRYAQRLLNSAKDGMGVTRTKLDNFGDTLNFAAHCQQWNAGGAAMAAQQAQRMQQGRQSATAGAATENAPETPKAKMVPLEKLLMPARVDDAAPDLGKEVANFNTGSIDENFFSSDDEMASEVQVMTLDEDDEDTPAAHIAPTEGDSDSERPQQKGRIAEGSSAVGGGVATGGGGSSSGQDTSSSDVEDDELEDAEAKAEQERLKALQREAEAEKAAAARLEEMQQAALKKAAEEEERLKRELEHVEVGNLDTNFLASDDDDEEEDKADTTATIGMASKNKGAASSDDSSDSEGGRPMIMADEDLSD